MAEPQSEVQYGTLDLMVLKTSTMGPLHGYGIARRIDSAQGSLALNQGTIYPALVRLETKGWISSDWGTSENNRRARFYSLPTGRKQLAAETDCGSAPWPWSTACWRTVVTSGVCCWRASGDR